MDFLSLALIREGGPWALLLSVLAAGVFLIWRGHLVPGPVVDRSVNGYVETIKSLREELTYYRAADRTKDETIATQAGQLQKMMTYSALGTHAIEDIIREAQKRGADNA